MLEVPYDQAHVYGFDVISEDEPERLYRLTSQSGAIESPGCRPAFTSWRRGVNHVL
jgi:hypothetical protein